MRVILEIPGQTFSLIDLEATNDEGEDGVRFTRTKGTVLLIAGLFGEDDESLSTIGIPDGEESGRLCVWRGLEQFESHWNEILRIAEELECRQES